MASIKEVIVSMIGYKIPDATVENIIKEHGLDPGDARVVSNSEQTKAMDLSRAGIIDFLITLPKTVRELDYQVTQQDADALADLRKRILTRHGILEDSGLRSFTDISNTH